MTEIESIGGEVGRLAFSNAVRAGGFVFVAGQPGFDGEGRVAEGVRAQTVQAFANIEALLREAGSGLDRLVKLTTMLCDMADLRTVVEVRRELLAPPYPADTVYQVSALARPGFLVEIAAVALMGAT